MNRHGPRLIVAGSSGEAAPEKTFGDELYEGFFGLRERPFDLVPNPRFLFVTGVQQEVLSTLRYGMTGPGGITLLIGEAGTGKTTLVQAAVTSLGDDRVQCVLISNPTLTRNEFYESLVERFRLGPEAGESKATFLSVLRTHLETRHKDGQITALVIDEAQSLPDELLEEIRLLSNLETSTAKLLSVVLAGQPELSDRLNQRKLRQLKQRIGLRCALRPFTLAETASYLAGRLRIAGGSPADIFTREAVGAIYEASKGIPRVINVIAENALIGGFAAQTKPVPRAIADEVIRDFDLMPGGGDVDRAEFPMLQSTEAMPQPEPLAAETTVEPAAEEPETGIVSSRKRFSFFG